MNDAPQDFGGCWPTRSQKLLLKASLLPGDEALKAWEEWIADADIERLDTGSYRMLPLLYRNLKTMNVAHPAMTRLKGVYRYHWCKNQILFHNMARLMEKLHEAGIKTMVLKGGALVLLHYKDYGLRPMDDFDVLVPTEQVMSAVEVLKNSGWLPVKEFTPEEILPKRHSAPFRSLNRLSLDLHWHVFEETVNQTDDDFWAAAIPVEVNEVQSFALNPADQMLHAFAHGIRWNMIPPFRWIADVMAILNTPGVQVDWERLTGKAEEFRVILPVREGLAYLEKNLGVTVPEDVQQRLQEMHVSKTEHMEYDVGTRRHNKYGIKRLSFIWVQYQEYLKNEFDGKNKYMSFPDFIRDFWKVEQYWKIPFMAVAKLGRSIYRVGCWHTQKGRTR